MKKEIWFFCDRPLMKRDYDRFGFETLKKRGFRVFYLDISGICNQKYAGFYQKEDISSYEGVIKPVSRKETAEYLRKAMGPK